jgi:hypothetical protein
LEDLSAFEGRFEVLQDREGALSLAPLTCSDLDEGDEKDTHVAYDMVSILFTFAQKKIFLLFSPLFPFLSSFLKESFVDIDLLVR